MAARPTKKRILDLEEASRLLEQLAPADRVLFIVAVDTLARSHRGGRPRHAPGARRLEDGARTRPLSARARAALDSLPVDGPYYFEHRRTAKTERDRRGAIRRMLERACKRCKPPILYGRDVPAPKSKAEPEST
jgi:hypothetical protein